MVGISPAYIDPGSSLGVLEVLIIAAVIVIVFIAALVAVIMFVVRKSRGSQQVMPGATLGFCSSCGNPLQERASFCSKCGAAVNPTQGQKK